MTDIARKAALAAVLALPALRRGLRRRIVVVRRRPASRLPEPPRTAAASPPRPHPLATILVAQNGMTLYMFARDQGGKSACSGACANFWPPYTGTPKAGNGPHGVAPRLHDAIRRLEAGHIRRPSALHVLRRLRAGGHQRPGREHVRRPVVGRRT